VASNRFYSHNGRAGILRRGAAIVIDTVIIAIVVVPLGYALQQVISDAIGNDDAGQGAGWLSASSVSLLLYLTYFTLLEARGGATLGKKLLGLRVRRRLGGDINLRDSVIRNVLRVVDGFPFVFVPGIPPLYFLGATVILTSEHRQRVGDWAAETVVMLSSYAEPAPRSHAQRPPTTAPATARRRRKK
jgi:uncharacterized RDD family membrane protein YckC